MNKFLLIIAILIFILILIIIIKCIVPFHTDYLTSFTENNFYYEIENALTPEECDEIIQNSKDSLVSSKVMSLDDKNNYKDVEDKTVRTSTQTWLENKDYSHIIKKVTDLVNKYSNKHNSEKSSIKINPSQYENIQVVRYHPNQEYKQHYDICHPIQGHTEHLKTCEQDYKKYNSVRYATVLFYLNDGYEGGETYFPKLNKKIKPKKGKALIFFNCNLNKDTKNNGLCDVIYNSEHAGLPVKKSNNINETNEKWIANVWIRTKSI